HTLTFGCAFRSCSPDRSLLGGPLMKLRRTYFGTLRPIRLSSSSGLDTQAKPRREPLVLLVIKQHSGIELFCGDTPLCARPTRETLRAIYGRPGDSRGASGPARAVEKLLQG